MSNETISVPREKLAALIAQCLDDAPGNPDIILEELRALLAQPAEQHQGEPIRLTAVAELVDDGDGGLEPSWILEGGTAELFAGMTLLVADNAPDLCHEDGSAEVYTRPGALLDTGTSSDKYKAELYDEVWQLAQSMGFGNVTDALMKLERQLQGNKSR